MHEVKLSSEKGIVTFLYFNAEIKKTPHYFSYSIIYSIKLKWKLIYWCLYYLIGEAV